MPRLTEYFAPALLTLAFRAFPFVVFAVTALRVPSAARFWALTGFFCVVLAAGALGASLDEVLVLGPLGLSYFTLVALIVHQLSRRAPFGRIVTFGVLSVLCVLVPGALVPAPLNVPGVVWGWEILLSSYSYCVEHERSRPARGLGECLFFLLVDPTLVYPERGKAVEQGASLFLGLSRCALGVAAITVQFIMTEVREPLAPFVTSERLRSASAVGYAGVLSHYSWGFLAYYAAHSGLASVQIGLMRLAGYAVPERYHYPFLAKAPQDFWRRWNTWVGVWAQRYVFIPLAFRARRYSHRIPAGAVGAFAVFATLVAVGLLHDFARYAVHLSAPVSVPLPLAGTLLFFALGILVVLWRWVQNALPRVRALRARGALRVLARSGQVVLFLHALFFTHWLAMASLSR